MHGAGSRQREAGALLVNGRAVRWGCVLRAAAVHGRELAGGSGQAGRRAGQTHTRLPLPLGRPLHSNRQKMISSADA